MAMRGYVRSVTAVLFGSSTHRSLYPHIFDRVRIGAYIRIYLIDYARMFTITIQRSFDWARVESVYVATSQTRRDSRVSCPNCVFTVLKTLVGNIFLKRPLLPIY